MRRAIAVIALLAIMASLAACAGFGGPACALHDSVSAPEARSIASPSTARPVVSAVRAAHLAAGGTRRDAARWLRVGAAGRGVVRWDRIADEHGVVILYPDGDGRAWNAGGDAAGSSARDGTDDVAFIAAAVADVQKRVSIDTGAVFGAGMSNGAMMAYRLACQTTLFAAIGPVSGTMPVGLECAAPAPISVIAVHGVDDTRVLYEGGASTVGTARIDATAQQDVHTLWARAASCDEDVTTSAPPLSTETAACPDSRAVQLVSIAGYGHEWPSPDGGSTPQGEQVYRGWDATAQLWSFFDAHRRAASG
jgi:polyhydroxybutyrate depolymerase